MARRCSRVSDRLAYTEEVTVSLLIFFLLLFIAAAAAGVQSFILGWNSRAWAAAFFAYAMLLTLPRLLPRLLGG
jgi:hypothetical protein